VGFTRPALTRRRRSRADHRADTDAIVRLTPSFWFESFQNWQSEFLAVLSLIVLSIFLRQKDSPQSKKVDEPNDKTGT